MITGKQLGREFTLHFEFMGRMTVIEDLGRPKILGVL